MRLAFSMLVLGMVFASGCDKRKQVDVAPSGDPKYVTNWTQLKVGMSKGQVRKIFGMPAYISRYMEDSAHVPRAREFGDDNAALKADMEAIFGEAHMWQYGRFDITDVSDEAFVVYFDAGGHVTHWRRAIKGPFASTTQPVEPADDASPAQYGQSPSELWKTPVIQQRK